MADTDRYAGYQNILFDRPAPNVLRLTLNKPDALNALDAVGHRELAEVWRDVDADPDVGAVILCGAGRAFSAGGDFAMIEGMLQDQAARMRVWQEAHDLVYNIVNCSKPIVSAMQGPAVGAGLVAALLSDVSIAARDAKIVDGHTRLGVAAGDHAALIWPLLCGMARAKYYLLLCEPLTGQKAEEIGLISLAVDAAELQDKAIEIAGKLAAGSPSAVRWTKYALNNWLRQAGPIFDTSLALEILGFAGSDAREGLTALKEHRKPRFSVPSSF